jgi:hypothetical protein
MQAKEIVVFDRMSPWQLEQRISKAEEQRGRTGLWEKIKGTIPRQSRTCSIVSSKVSPLSGTIFGRDISSNAFRTRR